MRSERYWNGRAGVYDGQVLEAYAGAYEKTIANARRHLRPGDRVLDYGCGTGVTTLPLAACVHEIVAADTSGGMLAVARRKAEEEHAGNIRFHTGSVLESGFPAGPFDAALAFNVLCYIPELSEALGRFYGLLRPGGLLLTATDCLGGSLAGLQKLWQSKTGKRPWQRMCSARALERAVAAAGFVLMESENLHGTPPNQWIAARKPE